MLNRRWLCEYAVLPRLVWEINRNVGIHINIAVIAFVYYTKYYKKTLPCTGRWFVEQGESVERSVHSLDEAACEGRYDWSVCLQFSHCGFVSR